MKLSELNKKIDDLRTARLVLHEELGALLANETISVGEARKIETDLRAQVVEINQQLAPMEMERAEIDRVVKGQPRKRAERWLSEPVTLS